MLKTSFLIWGLRENGIFHWFVILCLQMWHFEADINLTGLVFHILKVMLLKSYMGSFSS